MQRVRLLALLFCPFYTSLLHAQQLDSVHVYQWRPDGQQTVASAHTLGWRLHNEKAPYTTLKGAELVTVTEVMGSYKPSRPLHGPLPDLAHLGMVFSGGRPMVFGVTEDLERMINLTARREYVISGWSEHLYVRALLAKMLLER